MRFRCSEVYVPFSWELKPGLSKAKILECSIDILQNAPSICHHRLVLQRVLVNCSCRSLFLHICLSLRQPSQ
ncbi:hypothetical protein SLE2022_324200 [Rubroshorea leprosula]